MDRELKDARNKIKNAALVKKDNTLYAPLYHNLSIFKRFNILTDLNNTYIRVVISKGLLLIIQCLYINKLLCVL